jgi:hypothetical protein
VLVYTYQKMKNRKYHTVGTLPTSNRKTSEKGKRPKCVQMTEQQLKTPQIIDIVEIPPTQDIVQMPATQDIVQSPLTQDGSQTPDTAQIEDILQMAAQIIDVQPIKRALGLMVTKTSSPIWYRHSTGSFSMTLVIK